MAPSSSSSSSPTRQETNTIAVTCLPSSFFNPLLLSMLRDHFATFGDINQWIPLPTFRRILIVYEVAHHAELAKCHCDPIVIDGHGEGQNTVLRVYRADPNPIIPPGEQGSSWIPPTAYLQPPPVTRNFLISPPGSPPVGWEQIREDPPNAAPLAEDLITALKKLKTHEETSTRPLFEQLLDPMDGSGVGVYVENCDPEDEYSLEIREEEWVYGETAPARQKWQVIPTSLPPMGTNFA